MTETEAQSFISNVLKGFWFEWEPSNTEYKVWIRKLSNYDYGKAEKALGDWISEREYQGKAPKIGKVLKALGVRNAGIVAVKLEPIKVFELYEQDNPQKRQSFYVGSEKELRKRPAESYENEAEVNRLRFNNFYGGNWIIIQEWKRHFDKAG